MDKMAVIDFGGQYTHLIANRIRGLGVYSEVLPSHAPLSSLARYKGIILSGGPASVLEADHPTCDPALPDLGIPVLGICYGHQLMCHLLGGEVTPGQTREYGLAQIRITSQSPVFKNLGNHQQVWMSHGDTVTRLPDGFQTLAVTDDCPTAAAFDPQRKIFGLQFHPEVTHTDHGNEMLSNFIDFAGAVREWDMRTYLPLIANEIIEKVGNKKVFLLVSGGVDSTVSFALLNRILGKDRVVGLHIDTGLMRENESSHTMKALRTLGFDNLEIVDAGEAFLTPLRGKTSPEEKRKIIGEAFLDVKDRESRRMGLDDEHWLLAQGTIYPDTIESGGTDHAAVIKTHHNRVDRIQELIDKGLIVEPVADLYKNEIRDLGEELGLPHDLVWRHPFPGPGLGVRILCSDGAGYAARGHERLS